MVKFELDGKAYNTPSSWNEVEFGKFLDYLSNIAPQEPQALKDLISSHIEFLESLDEELSLLEASKQAVQSFESMWQSMESKSKLECYSYFALSVGFWCGLSSEDIHASLDRKQLEMAFWAIQTTLNVDDLKATEDFTGFSLKGEEYALPKKNMESSTVAEFAEACFFEEKMNDLNTGSWDGLLDVMVVLCRKRPSEELYAYNENRHKLRRKLFKQLKMDVVINVSFFLLKLNTLLSNNLVIYGMAQAIAQKEQQQLQTNTDGT